MIDRYAGSPFSGSGVNNKDQPLWTTNNFQQTYNDALSYANAQITGNYTKHAVDMNAAYRIANQ